MPNKRSNIVYLCKVLLSLLFAFTISHTTQAQTYNKTKKLLIDKKLQKRGNFKTASGTPSYCPSGPVAFDVYDTNYNTINSTSFSCNSIPFYVEASNSGDIVTPCILSEYTSTDIFISSNASEYFYEGGLNTFCLGPISTGCSMTVGSGGFDSNHQWGIYDIFSDPAQQHYYQFCYSSLLTLNTTQIQLQDCWSGDSLSPTKHFGLNVLGTNCFTDTVAANTDIGTAFFTIAPASASVALTDYNNGRSLINPGLLGTGTYTLTYNFTPPAADSCPTINGTYIFTVNSISISVNSPTICAGATATLSASGAATSYSWSPGLSATSGSTVTATPSSPGINIYTVTGTKGACKTTTTATVTVNALPNVTVNSATVCAGSSAILTANGASTYAWSPATGLSATTGSVVTATSTSLTTYTVTGQTAGCSSKATTTITVNAAPTITVNSATICAGGTATLTASGAATYTWSTLSNSASITVSPTTTTPYTVSATANGCSATKTTTVTVNALPSISINTATICAGGTATLTASGASTYTWSTNATGAAINLSPTTSTPYTVTGTDIFLCKNTATTTVTVNALPSISVNTATICAGGTATLTASGANTYTWNTAATGNSITVTPSATTPYTVTATNVNGCKNTATTTVTATAAPAVTVTSVTVCAGSSTTLSANGASTYTWSTSATGNSITITPNFSTTYTVTGTNINGCKNSAIAIVSVNALPTITVNNATVCAGNSAILTASGASTYTWSTSSSGMGIVVSPAITTVYSVTGTDLHGCKNSAFAIVNVNSLPTLTANVNSSVCVGQSIHFTASSSATPVTYNWNGPNGYTSSLPNPSIASASFTNAGSYIVTATSLGCVRKDTLQVVVDALPTVANAGNDTILYANSLPLNGNVPLIGTGTWSVISGGAVFTNNTSPNTQITNLQSGQTILQWTISNGACPASIDEVTIFVKDLLIPNGFSPNGDGVNDNFEIKGLEEYSNVKLNVFNRWGNLVYDSGDYKNNWNGKNMSGEDLSDDTYFYTLEISSRSTIKGYITLKRK